MKKLLLIMGLISLLTACGGGGSSDPEPKMPPPPSVSYDIKGSAVKGAIANAKINLYKIDTTTADLKGELVISGTSNDISLFENLTITEPLESAYIVEAEATSDSKDINTGAKPYLTQLTSIISKEDIENNQFNSITPFTHLIVEIAKASGQDFSSPNDLLSFAKSQQPFALETFAFGLNNSTDAFHTPAAIYEGYSDNIDNILIYRVSNEVLASLIKYIAESRELSTAEVIQKLALHILSNQFHDVAADSEIGNLIIGAPIKHLGVPNLFDQTNTQIPLQNFLPTLLIEAAITAPNFNVSNLDLNSNAYKPTVLSSDFDDDGWPDMTDLDDDNDGVEDSIDAFPFDATETLDNDADGVGDNADFYDNDNLCSAELDGNGLICYFTMLSTENHRLKKVENGNLIFHLQSLDQVLVYDVTAGHFNEPINIDNSKTLHDFTYVEDHDRIYLAYSDRSITYLTAASEELSFSQASETPRELISANNYLLIRGSSYVRSYDKNAILTDSANGGYYRNKSIWQKDTSRYYWQDNRLHYVELDQISGTFSNQTSANGLIESNDQPMFLFDSVNHIISAPDKIFDLNSFNLIGSIDETIEDAISHQQSFISISYVTGNTQVKRFDQNYKIVEEFLIAGAPIAITSSADSYYVITQTLDGQKIQAFTINDDIDNDGVLSSVDDFPFDPAAAIDNDNDGAPEQWNQGFTEQDSISGLRIDAFPEDEFCWLTSHSANDGSCDYSANLPVHQPTESVLTDDGILYSFDKINNFIYRWSVENKAYLKPLSLNADSLIKLFPAEQMLLSAAHNRLYLNYANGDITYIDLENFDTQIHFASFSTANIAIANAGNFLFVQPSNGNPVTINKKGIISFNNYLSYRVGKYSIWDKQQSRLYYLRDGSSTNLYYVDINQTSGELTQSGSALNSNTYFSSPILLSEESNQIVFGSGETFSTDDHSLQGNYGSFADGVWLSESSLLTIQTATDHFNLIRYLASGVIAEFASFDGEFIDIVRNNESIIIIYKQAEQVKFIEFVANDDSDGDGVLNIDDAFPLDIAASIDTDLDGFPDSWNSGYAESDSTTNLSLDAFTNDSACWLQAHDNGDGSCNYSATMPTFTPAEVIADNNSIIYLFDPDNNRINRWDSNLNSYTNPIYIRSENLLINSTPASIAYSAAHQRIYLGYQSGQITYINISEDTGFAEHNFARTMQSVNGLASVGNFLLAQDNSGAWESHYIFNLNGVQTDYEEWNQYSREYAYNNSNSRVYFFRDGSSPNDLMWEEIDQSTGLIMADGETPYHGSYSISPPILVSSDGSQVILGSGDIYDANDLTWQGSYGDFDKGLSLDNQQVLLAQNGQIYRISTDGQVYETITFTDSLIDIIQVGNRIYIITQLNNELAYTEYVINNDSDADTVDNLLDAFPLDIAASVDSDNDGYPDYWNAGYSEQDSTTGLELDAFANDSACWFIEHDNGEGVCDYSATLPSFTPAEILSDKAGMIYLFSPENNAVYRWNAATNTYTNPFFIGDSNVLYSQAPTKMSYSSSHQRLYFGYEDGKISYVSTAVDSDYQEQYFTRISYEVRGLAAVGNYVLAQDSSGAWYGHYIFDSNGNQTDYKDWNRYSRMYAYNSSNSRVYFFRDGTSPNDLHWQQINQVNGLISASGETPYHSSSLIRLPIAIINNGQNVLLGSGTIYDATDLTNIHSVGVNIEHVAAFDNLFAVSKEVNSSWSVELFLNSDFSSQVTFAQDNPVLALVPFGEKIIVVNEQGSEIAFDIIELGDQDNDNIPAWWEVKYGLSDDNPDDSLEDLDTDSLLNFEEYNYRTNPTLSDTDADALSDYDEINTIGTSPTNSDTDEDGLTDGEEYNTYLTNPLLIDTDGDTFSDSKEILQYGSDPNDINSIPDALTSLTESFEDLSYIGLWQDGQESNASWAQSSMKSAVGSYSLRSGNIDNSQKSNVVFSSLMSAGTFSFQTMVSSESCCDKLYFYLDGVQQQIFTNNISWQSFSIAISSGEHIFEWRYQKDGSASRNDDAAYIDDLSFVQ